MIRSLYFVRHARNERAGLIVMGLAGNSDFSSNGSSGVTLSSGRALPGALSAVGNAEIKRIPAAVASRAHGK